VRVGLYSINLTNHGNFHDVYNNVASPFFGKFTGFQRRVDGFILSFGDRMYGHTHGRENKKKGGRSEVMAAQFGRIKGLVVVLFILGVASAAHLRGVKTPRAR